MLPYQNRKLPVELRIDDLIGRLTLEEKVHLCHGCTTMEVGGIDRLGIPLLQMSDGPQGVRLAAGRTEDGRQTTALPAGIALAANFDPAAAAAYGEAIGRDAASVNVQASLGPGFNLMRTPLNGRNFEYYGEDPFLAGKTAAGYIRGCQCFGVAATPKHLALNNQEICRTTGSSEVDERTLRELYLTAFEIVTKESQPWMMMSSYNRINGQYAAECGFLQEMIAKGEWGFDGVMVSDWGGAHHTVGCALGGLDLEMGCPSEGGVFGKALVDAVQAGAVPETVVDGKVRRVLRMMYRAGVMDDAKPTAETAGKQQLETAAAVALGGMTLLKNENGLLPLDPAKVKRLVVVGPNADFRQHRGTLEFCGGSGAVFSDREVTPAAGLKAYGAAHGFKVEYFPVVKFDHDSLCPVGLFGAAGLACEYFAEDADLASGGKPLFTRADTEGIWNWAGAGAQTAGGSDGEVPKEHFALRVTGILRPPSQGAADMVFHAQHGRLVVKLDGKTVIDAAKSSLIGAKYHFDAGTAPGAKLEVEYYAYYTPGAQLRFGWREADTAGREAALAAAREADAVIFVGGTHHLYDKEALGWGDVPCADIPGLQLPAEQDAWIADFAAANPRCAVVLVNGSVVSVEPWIDRVGALLETWYAGESAGTVLARVLFGEAAPGGRLPCTWGRRLVDYACHANGSYPGERTGDDPNTVYKEGMFIGYRHFDRAGIAPRFPFGFGLTYTTFRQQLTGCTVESARTAAPRVWVTFTVTNTGKRSAGQVIQLYVGAVDPVLERPVKELKGFAKVTLAPGESTEIELPLAWRDFACWEPRSKRWTVYPGEYRLYGGTSAADIFACETITLAD